MPDVTILMEYGRWRLYEVPDKDMKPFYALARQGGVPGMIGNDPDAYYIAMWTDKRELAISEFHKRRRK